MNRNDTFLRRSADRLFGGLSMRWPVVLLFAVGAAALAAFFLIVPVFRNTSFERMGVTFEAWIFFAVLIMTNCKKPLEAAVKTFVFFLVSQPLIYLFQVPFSDMGWSLFGYYGYWFVWTLLTFPMAFVGWYITKRNWLSLLILAPILCFLSYCSVTGFRHAALHFPRMLVMALFCLGQMLLYLYAFTDKLWQKLLGLFVPLAAALILLLARPQVQLNGMHFLPDDPVLTEQAAVTVEDPAFASVSVESFGSDSMIRVQAEKIGETAFTIRDGENTYRYTLIIYEDDAGNAQVEIVPADHR